MSKIKKEGVAAFEPAARSVYIIDDDTDVRQSLYFLLSSSSIVAWPFASAADFLDQLPALVPGPILLDIRMPGIDGMEMLAILKQREVHWPIIMITAHGDVSIAVRAIKLGALEFLEKPFEPEVLDRTLEIAFGILDEIDASLRARTDARRILEGLTNRENQVTTILMEGVSNKVIAQRLGLSPRTVEMHRANSFKKMELRSIAEVIALVATANMKP